MFKNLLLMFVSTALSVVAVILFLKFVTPQVWERVASFNARSGSIVYQDVERVAGTVKDSDAFFDVLLGGGLGDAREGFIYDSAIWVRGKPLESGAFGLPFQLDVLGFRNDSVPSQADLVCLGDSQTWGANVHGWENWPSQLSEELKNRGWNDLSMYNMGLGGWSVVQYQYLLPLVQKLRPRLVVVAIYSGNDFYEALRLVSLNERFKDLLPKGDLRAKDSKSAVGKSFKVKLQGETWHFQPGQRLRANNATHDSGIAQGVEITKASIDKIVETARNNSWQLIFALIPTKEYALYPVLEREGISLPPDYLDLMVQEDKNLDAVVEHISNLGYAVSVDLRNAMRDHALTDTGIYPSRDDGHPTALGHKLIAQEIANAAIEIGSSDSRQNVVYNGGFETWTEDGLAGWTIDGDVSRARSDRLASGGRRSLRIDVEGEEGSFFLRQICDISGLSRERPIELTARVKKWDPYVRIKLAAIWQHGSENRMVSTGSENTTAWQALTLVVPVDPHTDRVTVQFFVYLGRKEDYVLVDDIRLIGEPTPVPSNPDHH